MAVNTGVLRVTYVYTLDTKTYTNQLHFKQNAGDTIPTSLASHASQHGAGVLELWQDHMEPLLVSQVSLTEIGLQYIKQTKRYPEIPPALPGTTQVLDWQIEEEAVYVTGLPSAGNVTADDPLPSFNAYRARKITSIPGRRGRGHNSISGVPEGLTSGNLLTTGDWTTWQTNAPLFLGSSYGFTATAVPYVMNPVVLSITAARALGTEFVAAGQFGYLITSVVPNRLIGTMVRRKKKAV